MKNDPKASEKSEKKECCAGGCCCCGPECCKGLAEVLQKLAEWLKNCCKPKS